jgi:hypothetical protein
MFNPQKIIQSDEPGSGIHLRMTFHFTSADAGTGACVSACRWIMGLHHCLSFMRRGVILLAEPADVCVERPEHTIP